MATTTIFIVSGTSTTLPADWNPLDNTVNGIGGGAAGHTGLGGSGPGNGAGGAGGKFCQNLNDPSSPSSSQSLSIGAGGTFSGNGRNTTWRSSVLVAPGGGQSTTAVGDTVNAGGSGGSVSSGKGGAGGGGAGGPNGAGKNGGGTSISSSITGGGGGGGAGGGSSTAGQAPSSSSNVGGVGGAAQDGTAGGAGANGSTPPGSGAHGSGGGGANGFFNANGGAGGAGIEWDSTHGAGGGGGGGGLASPISQGGQGGNYGGGGGGGGYQSNSCTSSSAGGNGGQGLIVLTYTPTSPLFTATTKTAALLAVLAAVQWDGTFIGGPGPYMPRQLNPVFEAVRADNPPIRNWADSPGGQGQIVQAWQPDPYAYTPLVYGAPLGPYMPPHLPVGVTGLVANPPPFSYPGRNPLNVIVRAWQPDPWVYNELGPAGGTQPYGPRLLNPSLTAVPENNPPFRHPARSPAYPSLIQGWQPDPWVFTYAGPALGLGPYLPRKLNPTVSDVPVNNPPFRHPGRLAQTNVPVWDWQPEIWPYVFTGQAVQAQPYGQVHLTPSIHGIARNDPPFTNPGRIPAQMAITVAWQPDPWVYVEPGPQGGTQPYGPRHVAPQIIAVPENNPPFGIPNKPTLSVIVGEWQPNPWVFNFAGQVSGTQPYGPKQLSPGIPGQSVDPPIPIDVGRQITEGIIVTGAQPDPWVYRYNGTIQAQPYGVRLKSPGTPGHSVDPPPFVNPGRKPQTNVPIWDWQPAVWPYVFTGGWEPYSQNKLPPSVTAVPIQINYRLTVRNVIVRTTMTGITNWPGSTYPPKNNP